MNACDSMREDLVAWLDGEMTPREAASMRDHVASCPGCWREVEEFRGTRAAVSRALSAPQAAARGGDGFDALWMAVAGQPGAAVAAGGEQSRRPGPARRRAAWRWAGGVGVALAAGIALVVLRSATGPLGRDSAAPGGGPSASGRSGERMARESGGAGRPAPIVRVDAKEGAVGERSAATPNPADLPVPDELRRRPGFFLDYPIVHGLEKLRRLEATNSVDDSGANRGDAG